MVSYIKAYIPREKESSPKKDYCHSQDILSHKNTTEQALVYNSYNKLIKGNFPNKNKLHCSSVKNPSQKEIYGNGLIPGMTSFYNNDDDYINAIKNY